MHLDNTYLTNRTVGRSEQPTPTAGAASRAAARGAAAADSAHVASAELQALLARVRQAPDVRPEVVARVAQRLASGYYLSRDAAAQTADALRGA
jgi:hypothetical protein